MFTGLVQKVGQLIHMTRAQGGWSLKIAHESWPTALELGESVAVQGACLTVTDIGASTFTADLLDETLNRTALSQCKAGSRVNLERALALGDRLGGHIVSGHVDETGTLLESSDRGRDIQWRLSCSPQFSRQTVMKGSVALDGVSLTVSGLGPDWFEINLIPHTLHATSLCDRNPGDLLNLESDILGKYVARLLGREMPESSITENFLAEHGFL